METFAHRLTALRENVGIGRESLAKLLNISEALVEGYETGYSEPSIETLERASRIFGVSVAYVAMLTDDPKVTEDGEIKEIYVVKNPKHHSGKMYRDDIVGTVYMNRSDMHGRDYYAFVMNDDGLKDARITTGDLLIVRKQQNADEGDIAVVMTPEGKSVVRRLFREGRLIILKPENPDYDDIILDGVEDEFEIMGKVVEIRIKSE